MKQRVIVIILSYYAQCLASDTYTESEVAKESNMSHPKGLNMPAFARPWHFPSLLAPETEDDKLNH